MSLENVGLAREHARAQAGATAATQPTIPARLAGEDVVWDETLGPGGYAARVLPRGTHLRIADLDGDTNVTLVLHHAARPAERLNVADTVKLQWNAYLGAGALLLSDMGRVLTTILPDSTGALDLLCGASPVHARPRLLLGLAKHDLTLRDLPPAANLFSSVPVAADGTLGPRTPSGSPAHFTLRAELDVLVTVAVGPHPVDDRPSAPVGLARFTARDGAPAAASDSARAASPEAQRAFENTDDVLLALGVTS